MLNCSDHCLDWFVLRMSSLTSSASSETLRCVSPNILPSAPVHSDLSRVLVYSGMSRHLNIDVEDDLDVSDGDENSANDSSISDEAPIDVALVSKMIQSMRAPTQETVNECAKDARRIEMAITKKQIGEARMESFVVTLGFLRSRAHGFEMRDKVKFVKKWTKSIKDSASSESAELESDEVVPYAFPYSMLNANEIKALLQKRVGSNRLTMGDVPGPHPKPANVKQRTEALMWIDQNPGCLDQLDESSDLETEEDDNHVRNAILNGIVSKAFLKGLEGKEKAAARLGHQNEPQYIKQYFQDSKGGIVPGIKLVDIRRSGLARKQGKAYVCNTADDIAFEWQNLLDDDDDSYEFDRIRSHLVECKCRSGSGANGTLNQAIEIQERVAELKGGRAGADIAAGSAVYLRVSSDDQDLLNELIPNSSERVQILHHAYTYNRNTVAFLVGNPQGRILYRLIITFSRELLESYGQVMDFVYDQGLNVFYEDIIDNVPLKLIEGILLSTPKLKSKFQLDDFMTSFLIWRELLPDREGSPNFPIPPCNMLLPMEHSLWNTCKGGSDTVTRFTWNCMAILPVKMPQTVVVARFFLLYATVYHRILQVVTMRKKIDVERDTIQSVRERNNKRFSFHQSLNHISKGLLRMAGIGDKNAIGASNEADNKSPFEEKPAGRYNADHAEKRYRVDDSILGRLDETGVTPYGRGKVKASLDHHSSYDEYKERLSNCQGFPMRNYVPVCVNGKIEKFKTSGHTCDLCGTEEVTWICSGRKGVFFTDKDCSKTILTRLKHKKHGPMLRRRFPALAELHRGDVPAYYNRIGQINGRGIYAGMSCYQIAHANRLCDPCSTEDVNEDTQLLAVASTAVSSLARSC